LENDKKYNKIAPMNEMRNIIIVTGRSAVGKTTTSNYLRNIFASQKIPCEEHVISDALSLIKMVELDDKQGGLHHTHDWCKPTTYQKGHSHQLSQPILPFTVLDNTLPDAMLFDFFTELTKIPKTDTIYIAEWAAGLNNNPKDTLFSSIDYSYAKINEMFRKGILPTHWIKQVISVVHIVASDESRFTFNEKRNIPCSEKMLDGTMSWYTPEEILRFYDEDDFINIIPFFQKNDAHIYEITNSGNSNFFKELLYDFASHLFSFSSV
jgi:hypothetical protein